MLHIRVTDFYLLQSGQNFEFYYFWGFGIIPTIFGGISICVAIFGVCQFWQVFFQFSKYCIL